MKKVVVHRFVFFVLVAFSSLAAVAGIPKRGPLADSGGDSVAVLKEEGASSVVDAGGAMQRDSASIEGIIASRDNVSDLQWYTMFARIPDDWIRYSKITFRKEKIPAILAMAALTGALVVADQPLYRFSDEFYRKSAATEKVSEFFEYLGDGKPQFGLAAAFGAYGFIAKDERALRTGSQIVEVILACGTVIQVLKHITGRESPLVSTRTNGRWVFFPNQIEYHKKVPHYDAFPSGHIATALATITVVMENYPETKPWLMPIGYTVVGLIGVGLGNTGIHWYSDFPLGLALGYQFGMIASHPEGIDLGGSAEANKPKLSVLPNISPMGNGVKVALQF